MPPTDPEADAVLAVIRREERISARVRQLEEDREARVRAAAGDLPPMPTPTTLADLLRRPERPIEYTIDGLLPRGESALLTGPRKAGKTSMRDNLARSLVDGAPFLGQFEIPARVSSLMLLDFELSENVATSWLRRQRIENTSAINAMLLKGRAREFSITDRRRRSEWAKMLADLGTEILIVDCLKPILDALGLDEHRDTSRLLNAMDELAAEAGGVQWIALHHTGWEGERARGDSGAEGVAGVLWRTTLDGGDLSKPRFFSAFGRAVDVPEGAVTYDPQTGVLTMIGGSRAESRQAQKTNEYIDLIVRALAADRAQRTLTDEPATWTTNQAEKVIRAADGPTSHVARKALQQCAQKGLLAVSNGARGAHIYALTDDGLAYAEDGAA